MEVWEHVKSSAVEITDNFKCQRTCSLRRAGVVFTPGIIEKHPREPDALISPACPSSTCRCGSRPRVKTEPFQWQTRHSMALWGQSQTLLTVLMTSSVITLPLLLTPALKNNICPVCHYQAVAVHHLGLLRHPENGSPSAQNRSSI